MRIMSETTKKINWIAALKTLLKVLTAVLTALGLSSCMRNIL
jgi:hypothetical protein